MVERIDPDYDPESDEFEAVAKLLAKSKGRMAVFHYKDGNGFQKWILGVAAALAVIAVGGGVAMFGKLAALEQQEIDSKADMAEVKREVNDVKRLLLESRSRRQ